MAGPSDILVVGAGIVGCAIAHELARRGASVEIVDDRPVGMGATQASAGVLAPFIEAREGSPLLDLTVRSLDLYDMFMERVTQDSGVAVPYRRTGTLHVATTDAEMRALEATTEVLARRGVPALLLDAQAVRNEEPHLSDGAIGGLLIESHGFVAAGELTHALAAAARRQGAHVIERSRVRRISQQLRQFFAYDLVSPSIDNIPRNATVFSMVSRNGLQINVQTITVVLRAALPIELFVLMLSKELTWTLSAIP